MATNGIDEVIKKRSEDNLNAEIDKMIPPEWEKGGFNLRYKVSKVDLDEAINADGEARMGDLVTAIKKTLFEEYKDQWYKQERKNFLDKMHDMENYLRYQQEEA